MTLDAKNVKKGKRKDREHEEQSSLFKWAQKHACLYPELDSLYAIPNGGRRSISVAKKMKAEGVKKGVPDLCLPVPSGSYHGLYIEMKVKPNRPKPEQKEWLKRLHDSGYAVSVCYTWEAASALIITYLSEKPIYAVF